MVENRFSMNGNIWFCISNILAFFISANISTSSYGASNATSLEYVYGCEIDLDGNHKDDLVILLNTRLGRKLVINMYKDPSSFFGYQIQDDISGMHLECMYGKIVRETAAGKGEKTPKDIVIPHGAYIVLSLPEASSVAYFWENGKFRSVWLAD